MTLFTQLKKSFKQRMISRYILVLFFLVFTLPFVCSNITHTTSLAPRTTVDYIFLNSNIITVNSTNPIAEAIAICNETIIDIGSTSKDSGAL